MQKLLLALILINIPALAQSAFDGTWRLNTNDAQVNVTEKFLVAKGLFSCAACDPPVKDFPADGQPHEASGAPYYDAATVRIVDEYTVEFTTTRNGKPVEYMKFTVSRDGRARRSLHFRKWPAKP
jgi:hypothetical protein